MKPSLNQVKKYQNKLDQVKQECSKIIVGQQEIINSLFRAILSNGHVLVEGIPGIAKTLIVRTLARVTGSQYSRIQFTADLLPTDIIGLTMYIKEKNKFSVVKGPVFANYVIADEINRSPPKCITGDTEIALSDGRVMQMEEIFKRYNGKKTYENENESWILPKKQIRVPSFNVKTMKIENKPVKLLYKQKTMSPISHIILESGREIKTSPVHPFFSINGAYITMIEANKIKKGDCVLIPKNINITPKGRLSYDYNLIQESDKIIKEIQRRKNLYNKIIRLKHLTPQQIINKLKLKDKNDKELVKTFYKFKPKYLSYNLKNAFFAKSKQFGQIKLVKKPKIITKELTQFFALLISETYHYKQLHLDMKDKKLVKYFKSLLKKLFNYDTKILNSENKKKRIALNSITLNRLLGAMGYKSNLSRNKSIPDFLMGANNSIIKEFLRMFFEAEGTVKKDSIVLSSASKILLNQISYLLLRFGIICRLSTEYRETQKGELPYYILRIYGKFIGEFNNQIGFFGSKKKRELKFLLKKISDKHSDYLPGMHNYIRKIRKDLKITHKKFFNLTGLNAWNLENRNNRLRHGRDNLERVYKGLKRIKDLKEFKKLIQGDFSCDFIKNISIIKPKKEYTLYDFTIDGNHSFIAGYGGIISHNTQSALLEAMQERQVTIGTETFRLPNPFFVMATQNPIESSGVYTLPEAQVDRFLFKLKITYPKIHEENEILTKNITIKHFDDYKLSKVTNPKEMVKMQDFTKKIFLSKDIEDYIVRLVDATRNPGKYKIKQGHYIDWGCSPRASIGLFIGSKAEALLQGNNYVIPSYVKKVAHDVMRHRILLNYEGQAENINTDDIIKEVLEKVPTP